MDLQRELFRAIDTITEKKLSEISFDKTIECIITNDSKADLGEYEVQYQDIIVKAFSNINTVKYAKNENVYVLIPGGDFSNKKTIIGKKDSSGEEFIDIPKLVEQLNKIGESYVDEEPTFSLTLNPNSAGNKIEKSFKVRGNDMVKDYPLKTNLLIGAILESDLISENGDYGIELEVVFDDNIQHIYKLSLVGVTGNPYQQERNYQYKVFTLPTNKLTKVVGARTYIEGFQDSAPNGFVKFSQLEIVYVKSKDAEGLEQFWGSLKSPKGTVFKNGVVNQDQRLVL